MCISRYLKKTVVSFVKKQYVGIWSHFCELAQNHDSKMTLQHWSGGVALWSCTYCQVWFSFVPWLRQNLYSNLANVGTFPGAAKQDAGDKMEPPSEPDSHTLQHRCHVRGLHRQPAQTARQPWQWQNEAGGWPAQHARPCWGLQKQVRTMAFT